MKTRFILSVLFIGANLANAQPICTPNLTPEQAFLAIKNQNNPTAQPTPISSQSNPQNPVPISPTQPISSLININTASEAELVQLKGISSKKAQDIILYREMISPFHSVDDLDNVKGIGKATVDKNRNIITVGDGKTVAK